MSDLHDEHLPEELQRVGEWLSEQRRRPSELELDNIKRRALAQASRQPRRAMAGRAWPKRALTPILTLLILCVGTGGALAVTSSPVTKVTAPVTNTIAKVTAPVTNTIAKVTNTVATVVGQSSSQKSAADGQYKPGKGCGDKNHEHEREDECKKPPK